MSYLQNPLGKNTSRIHLILLYSIVHDFTCVLKAIETCNKDRTSMRRNMRAEKLPDFSALHTLLNTKMCVCIYIYIYTISIHIHVLNMCCHSGAVPNRSEPWNAAAVYQGVCVYSACIQRVLRVFYIIHSIEPIDATRTTVDLLGLSWEPILAV